MTTTAALPDHLATRRTAVGLPVLMVAMTSLTGLVDAVSYLGLGHVLVANMTGNVVFLGFALAGASGFSVSAFVVALGGFLLGAAAGGRLAITMAPSPSRRRRWLSTVTAIESLLTLAAAGAATLTGFASMAPFAVIALLALGLGLQNATVRKVAIPDLTTTVLTMTLTGLAADSRLAGGDHPRVGRRIGSVLAMLLGAVVGALLVRSIGLALALVVLAGLYAAIAVLFVGRQDVGQA